nr:MAG TPA: hypothetical protein [Caudoviricetes sp.]
MINIYFPCRINVANLCSLVILPSYSYFTTLIYLYIISRITISKCKMIKMCSI